MDPQQLSYPSFPLPSTATEGSSFPVRTRRGPPPKSCTACRLRRVRCTKEGTDDKPCQACEKKGIACIFTEESKAGAAQAGRRNETAKMLYGSLGTSSVAIVPSGREVALADNEMSETLGFELLNLYSDAGKSAPDPLFPPPVFDAKDLRNRFDSAGRRFTALSDDDQLICRVVFAAAARLRPSSKSDGIDSVLVRQLTSNAQSHADAAGAWRVSTVANVTSLLLLQRVAGEGEIDSAAAKPYLVSIAAHLNSLSRSNSSIAIFGQAGANPPALVWCSLLADVCSAIERREPPIISNRDFVRFVSRKACELPAVEAVHAALQDHPALLLKYGVRALSAFLVVGRRLANYLNRVEAHYPTVNDANEMMEIWLRLEALCQWGREVMMPVMGSEGVDKFSVAVLEFYVGLSYAAAGFHQTALVKHFDELPPAFTHNPEAPFFPLHEFRHRFLRNTSASLRRLQPNRTPSKVNFTNFLSIFTGSLWSTQRLAWYSLILGDTSPWDEHKYPAGPQDKLDCMLSLLDALENVARAYPGEEIENALGDIKSKVATLRRLLGTPDLLPASALGYHPASIGAISRYVAILDEAEAARSSESYHAPPSTMYDVKPSFFPSAQPGPSYRQAPPPSFDVRQLASYDRPPPLSASFDQHHLPVPPPDLIHPSSAPSSSVSYRFPHPSPTYPPPSFGNISDVTVSDLTSFPLAPHPDPSYLSQQYSAPPPVVPYQPLSSYSELVDVPFDYSTAGVDQFAAMSAGPSNAFSANASATPSFTSTPDDAVFFEVREMKE